MQKDAMQKVSSSNLSAVGYNEDSKELYVEFKNGNTYKYRDVPKQTYADLLSAESIGSKFNKSVRTVYSCIQVKEKEERPVAVQFKYELVSKDGPAKLNLTFTFVNEWRTISLDFANVEAGLYSLPEWVSSCVPDSTGLITELLEYLKTGPITGCLLWNGKKFLPIEEPMPMLEEPAVDERKAQRADRAARFFGR